MKLTVDGREYQVEVQGGDVTVDGTRFAVTLKGSGQTRTALVNGRSMRIDLGDGEDARTVNVDGREYAVSAQREAVPIRAQVVRSDAGASVQPKRVVSANAVKASMAGRVLRIAVAVGDVVQSGALLLILEAMKMENEIRSPRAGTVKAIAIAEGDRVGNGDPLIELE